MFRHYSFTLTSTTRTINTNPQQIRSKRELQEKIQREIARRKHMEVEFAGIEVERVRKDSAELNSLREAVQQERERHRLKVSVLEEKLQWHVENAEIVGKNVEIVRKQRDEIQRLKEELSQDESLKVRVRLLEKKLRLAKAKNAPSPGSIESLVAAVGPSEEEQKREKDLLKEVETSKLELKNQREEFDMKLRSLRQEHERVVSDMEKQLRDLRRTKKVSDRASRTRKGAALSSSKKNQSVDSTSKFWRKKIKDLKQSHKKEREGT